MRTIQLLTVVLLGLAAISTARVVAQQPDVGSSQQPAVTDPLAKEMERCKLLNQKAESDERCQAAYAENRKRFFAPPPDYHSSPVDMFPSAGKEPWTTDRKSNPQPSEK